MPTPIALDYAINNYISVTLSPRSSLRSSPDRLAQHPAVSYVGLVGELQDVQLVSVPKADWAEKEADVLEWLKARDGVIQVNIHSDQKTRARRGGGEL
jgi:hypothetical protein